MISIPFYVLLIPFSIFLLLFAFFSLMNIANLLRYGARNFVGFVATFIFLSGTAVILFFTWQTLQPVDWTATAPLVELPANVPL
jgi:hypothetical protein